MAQRLQRQLVVNVAGFGVLSAQKLSPSRQVIEEMFGFDQSTWCFSTSPDGIYLSTIDQDLCPFDRVARAGSQSKARDAGYTRQSFPTETKGMNISQVVAGPDLTGRMALQTQQSVVR